MKEAHGRLMFDAMGYRCLDEPEWERVNTQAAGSHIGLATQLMAPRCPETPARGTDPRL